MREIEAVKVIETKQEQQARVGKFAPEGEPNVSGPTIVRDAETGEVVLVADRYAGDMAALRNAMKAYPLSTTLRASGIRNVSGVFGYMSRNVLMRRNQCRSCNGAGEAPEAHGVIVQASETMAEQLHGVIPNIIDRDKAVAEAAILPEWRMGTSPWTSGVLNETSALPYHFDRNNLRPVWSVMVVARRGVRGGHLHVPAYDLRVECRDGDIVAFAGWEWVHGVTPMRREQKDGYRYTAVFYCVSKMKNCLPFEEEMRRGTADRSERENDMRPNDERIPSRQTP